MSCVIDESSVSSTAEGRAKTPDEKPPLPPPPPQSTSHSMNVEIAADDDPPKRELVIVKQEPSNGSGAGGSSSGVPEHSHEPSGVGGLGGCHQDRDLQQTAVVDCSPSAGYGNNRRLMTTKYCKACDISFNYLSTFIAHKKYYCRNSAEYKCNAENAKAATVT